MLQKGLIRELSQAYLTDKHHFGTGKDYRGLKDILLIPVSRHVVGKKSTTYSLVRHEFLQLLELTGIDAELAREEYLRTRISYLSDKFADELASGEFQFSTNKNPMSFRVYHPLTNEMSDVRDAVLSTGGFRYQYDVKSCFPVLVYQWLNELADLPYLKELVQDPDLKRRDLAHYLGIYVPTAKDILSALLFGAPIRHTPNDAFCIYKMLEQDDYKWQKLANWPWIRGLIADYKLANELLPSEAIDVLPENDRIPYASASGAERFYFSCEMLEKIVRRQMIEYIRSRGGKTFPIHDCVASDLDLTTEEIENYIKEQTKLEIRLSKSGY